MLSLRSGDALRRRRSGVRDATGSSSLLIAPWLTSAQQYCRRDFNFDVKNCGVGGALCHRRGDSAKIDLWSDHFSQSAICESPPQLEAVRIHQMQNASLLVISLS